MTTIEYTDGTYTEVVDGWTIVVHDYSPGNVSVTEPSGRYNNAQDITIDKDGDITFEVTRFEKGRGFNGDCAEDRRAPVTVIVAAIRVWNASRTPSEVTNG